MKTKALFAGTFAVLLALAILPGAFAQQTGASPEEGAVEEVTGRAVISDMYGVCAYQVCPRVGPAMQAFMLAFGVTGWVFADILEVAQSLCGMNFQSAIDEMTGPSPHMMPAFAGILEGCLGCNAIDMCGGCFSIGDRICSMPVINSLCWWSCGETLMRHMFGPATLKEYCPQSYGIEG